MALAKAGFVDPVRKAASGMQVVLAMRPYGSPGIARYACEQEDGIATVSALAVLGHGAVFLLKKLMLYL